MGSLKLVRQIDCQRDRCHGVLRRVRLVSHLNRKPKIRDTDAVDGNFPVVGEVLRIDEAG
jgi:hypothetical protein